jgi:hypothetical protein
MHGPDIIDDWFERQFLAEWLTYATNRYTTTFDASRYLLTGDPIGLQVPRGTGWAAPQDHHEFEEHRTEQAIMTLLCHKYAQFSPEAYTLHREADQSGEEAHFYATQPGNYRQLFEQTWLGSNHPVTGSKFRRIPE